MPYNKTIILGNLTRDVELRYTPGNTPVAGFGMAVNRKWKSQAGEMQEEVLFIDCEAWGKTAETLNQYIQKGRQVLVEGHLKLDQWDDKDGNKRSKIKLVVESFSFVNDGQRDGGKPQTAAAGTTAAPAAGRDRGHVDMDDDLVPF